MKTFLIAVVLSFVLAPSALLRRNAAWLAEHPAAKLEYSTQLLATHFPIDIKPAGGSLQGKWQIDAKAQSCTLVLSLPGGEERAYTWKGGVEVKAQGGGGWPEVEALLWGACGIWAAGVGGGEPRVGLERFLSSMQINLKASELRLLGREVVYAVGATGERTPQYWIDKEDYSARGLRWLGAAGTLWELRLKQSDRMELWREGQLALRVWARPAKPKGK